MKLTALLEHAEKNRYAVGSFSPRYVGMIEPVLLAAQENKSPAIVQISQKELNLYGITPAQFSKEFFSCLKKHTITVPTVLHLDHTKDPEIIKAAIAAGFESVMIDASEKSFEENVQITKEIVDYAHAHAVCVEAELGKIGTTDMVETDNDEELYTKPQEAEKFVRLTGVDALAVSVGTAHGVYTVRQPNIQYDIITQIKKLTDVYLVLHGGSGVPAEMIIKSYSLPCGGISKVNIATDLELSLLESLKIPQRMTNKWCESLPLDQLTIGRNAVKKTVADKMKLFLFSAQKEN